MNQHQRIKQIQKNNLNKQIETIWLGTIVVSVIVSMICIVILWS